MSVDVLSNACANIGALGWLPCLVTMSVFGGSVVFVHGDDDDDDVVQRPTPITQHIII